MLYRVLHVFLRVVFRLWLDLRVAGMENLPARGPVIVVANHIHALDPPVCGALLPRPAYYMAKAELFRFRPFAWLIRAVHAYPVRRGKADREALRTSLALLARGQVLLIFPEGHRSPDGRLQPARPGVVFLARKSGAPLVPVGIVGHYRFRGRVCFSVGPPFTLDPGLDPEQAGAMLMARIAAQMERGRRGAVPLGNGGRAGIK